MQRLNHLKYMLLSFVIGCCQNKSFESAEACASHGCVCRCTFNSGMKNCFVFLISAAYIFIVQTLDTFA